jgi:hypothetical protein
MYGAPQPLEPDLSVFTEDQFGLRTLRAIGARVLLVPRRSWSAIWDSRIDSTTTAATRSKGRGSG